MPKLVNKFIITALSAMTACTAWSVAPSCLHKTPSDSAQMETCITLDNLVKHLREFQKAADNNPTIPGSRFMGTEGYEASKNYVVKQLKDAGYNLSSQTVPVTLTYISKPRVVEQISPTKKILADDSEYAPLVGSGAGEVTAKVQTIANNACDANDFASFTKGRIALLTFGGCDTTQKIRNAAQAGASAIIVANDTAGIYYVGFTPTPAEHIPSFIISSDVAKSLMDTIKTGTLPTMHIKFNAVQMKTTSENIFAESKAGDPNHVVMVGAHLDSSAGNAGMNDNASAAASVLEIALQMQKVKTLNKLRFAFWTGEEIGLVGSNYYVAHLTDNEKAKIAYYLNYEILGAPNGARLIMDAKPGVTPPGSEKIRDTYVDYFKQKGLKYVVFDPALGRAGERSDMYAFMKAGIPVGYLVSGANIPWSPMLSLIFTDLPKRVSGVFMHPCYHKLCDRLTTPEGKLEDPNFDFNLYLQLTKAAAYAVYSFAMKVD